MTTPSFHNSNSLKISEFTSQSILQDTDFFNIVRSGTNYKIAFSSLKNDLGVTGSLSSVGSPSAIPVLNTFGNDYQIRSIETSKGLVSNISAQNGINIATNFTQSGIGSALIDDLTASQYKFKTLVGGQNISLTDSSDSITVNFSPTTGTTKTVVVSQESDFPAAIGGVITLANDTDYLVVNDISTANRFVVGRPTSLRASTSQMVSLTYTGTGNMFSGVDSSFKVVGITLSCPNGTLFDFTAPSLPSLLQLVESNIAECDIAGEINGNFITRFTNVAFEDIKTNGLLLSGTNNILVFDTVVAFLNGGTLLDFGTSTFQSVTISNNVIADSAVGTTFASGLANSGNIVVGGLGTIVNNKGFGSGNPLSGITSKDTRWVFDLNNTIPDTRNDGLVYTENNALVTTIPAVSTYVKVNAVFTEEDVSRFTSDATGRLTYIGEVSARLPIDVAASVLMSSAGDKQVNICIGVNGTVLTQTCVQVTASSSKAGAGSCIWQYDFQPNDYVEVFISNESDAIDIIGQSVVLRVN